MKICTNVLYDIADSSVRQNFEFRFSATFMQVLRKSPNSEKSMVSTGSLWRARASQRVNRRLVHYLKEDTSTFLAIPTKVNCD
ncbi:MAG: hypothetical protein GY820_46515 [Gammaproteobacteria bacterium]|nr:hypothetical protein [Gammaproteobacteria bacterium]